ncbi:uncharacterized protein M421DRAFT_232764 [Didymella exigua CBS 183.55]|uniref:Uncharacterized protein n=1 Tax=Didymella exigua CBS 183.55 TaxID=1150837 RepID=A0A6A5RFG7_9PLEO|nr:uncharacterized protein M421DRAFT_232764 [Didymella exigua CBS 183.55]KAF1925844.1 hypothetical protein M421DRAFT_232764 [Didymella exigua CBS 183.55]
MLGRRLDVSSKQDVFSTDFHKTCEFRDCSYSVLQMNHGQIVAASQAAAPPWFTWRVLVINKGIRTASMHCSEPTCSSFIRGDSRDDPSPPSAPSHDPRLTKAGPRNHALGMLALVAKDERSAGTPRRPAPDNVGPLSAAAEGHASWRRHRTSYIVSRRLARIRLTRLNGRLIGC